ncbi:agamous-like MADS-box protein AGL29 [Lycium ferocissimum]|uniref:agamous-like MADS-box protein AGL29 n=1 Tax=Lycium ferocissimum TaxID=112874 RepID=UPI002814D659|nr:agamous-like MADS-box protein AGL29 [Lycium ferocissimum]
MERKVSRGRQKIEMKLVECKESRYVTFSKRKQSLFMKADKLSTLMGADVGVLLFSPSGKTYSYGSTSIENIINRFLEWRLDNPHVVDQPDVGKAFDDLYEEFQVVNEKKESRKRRYEILYHGSEIPSDKHRLEQLVALKLRLDKIKKDAKNNILAERAKLDLNVVPDLYEGESSGTH